MSKALIGQPAAGECAEEPAEGEAGDCEGPLDGGDAVAAIRVVGVCEDHVLEPVQDGGLDAGAELAQHRHEDGHEQSEGEGVRPVPQPPLPASLSLGEDGEGGDGRYARHGAVLFHISREGLQAVDRVEGQRLVHKPPLCVVFVERVGHRNVPFVLERAGRDIFVSENVPFRLGTQQEAPDRDLLFVFLKARKKKGNMWQNGKERGP